MRENVRGKRTAICLKKRWKITELDALSHIVLLDFIQVSTIVWARLVLNFLSHEKKLKLVSRVFKILAANFYRVLILSVHNVKLIRNWKLKISWSNWIKWRWKIFLCSSSSIRKEEKIIIKPAMTSCLELPR